MRDEFFCTDSAVTLIGGGALEAGDLAIARARAPGLVAADSGACAALSAGWMPDAVFGDFDSITDGVLAQIDPDRLFRIPEQDTTDFHKALSRIDAPLILAVGFLGERVDHQLAVLHVLARLAEKPCILIGRHEVIFHLSGRIDVAMEKGDVVSLFPMAEVAGRSTGLEWPIDGLAFSPAGQVGTSNRALGPVSLEVEGPGLLAILPRGRLDAVIEAFRSRGDAV